MKRFYFADLIECLVFKGILSIIWVIQQLSWRTRGIEMLKQFQEITGVENIRSVVEKSSAGYVTRLIVKLEDQNEELQFAFVSSDPIFIESVRKEEKRSSWKMLDEVKA